MGSYTFKWEDPAANEVYVTGTFDDWRGTVQLDKKGDVFEKSVELPSDQRVLYKASQFLVDNKWTLDPTAPKVTGEDGITNNILPPEKVIKADPMDHTGPGAAIMSTVTPTSTTVDLAKNVPLEKNTRGEQALHDAAISSAAPDSSTADLAKNVPLEGTSSLLGTQQEPSDFSVKPIPETDGPGNPIHLKPGDKVPDPSTLTSHTIQSTVHDDDELKKASEDSQQVFRVSPLPATAGTGNPIHLQPGEPVPDPSTFTNNTVTSAVTTDKESFDKSGSALSGPSVLPPVTAPHDEGTGIIGLPPISKNMIPESSLPIGGDTTAIENGFGVTVSTVGPTSTTAALAANVPLEPKHAASEEPEVTKEGQKEAHASGEANASAEGPSHGEIPDLAIEAGTSATNGVTPPAGKSVSAATTAKDTASPTTGIDTETAKQLPDEVPQMVKESITKAHVDPEATTNPEAVHEKKEVESELLHGHERAGEPAQPESRDVSPMSKPATTAQTIPTATSGVATTTTDKVTESPQTPAAPGDSGAKTGAAESSKPSTDSPTNNPTDKKKKRFSWLGKVKEKLHLDKDKEKK